jgi:hypothetical protein
VHAIGVACGAHQAGRTQEGAKGTGRVQGTDTHVGNTHGNTQSAQDLSSHVPSHVSSHASSNDTHARAALRSLNHTASSIHAHAAPTAITGAASLSNRLSSFVRSSLGGGSMAGNHGGGQNGQKAHQPPPETPPASSEWIKKWDSSAAGSGAASTSALGSQARVRIGGDGEGRLDEVMCSVECSVGPLSRAMEEGVYLMTSELEDVALLRAHLHHHLGLLFCPPAHGHAYSTPKMRLT